MAYTRFIFILFLIASLSFLFALCKGSTSIPFEQLLIPNSSANFILLDLRLPRALTAFVSGGLLALSGALMQILLQNPLADPYVLGTSSAAAFVTLLCMLLGASGNALIAGACVGSFLSICLMLLLARKHRFETHTMLLAGIAIACAFSAGVSVILLLSPDVSLHGMLFWLSGDLNDASYPWVGLAILAGGLGTALILTPGLDIYIRGEREGAALGLSHRHYRLGLYLLTALLTGTAVTLSGCIGFIGLIIPHMVRFIWGGHLRLLLPAATALGGAFLLLADTLARSLFAPMSLPVGLVMALIGVPIFIGLLQT